MSFAETYLASQAVTVAASVVVLLANTLLQKILAKATLWERNYTVTSTAKAVTQKVHYQRAMPGPAFNARPDT